MLMKHVRNLKAETTQRRALGMFAALTHSRPAEAVPKVHMSAISTVVAHCCAYSMKHRFLENSSEIFLLGITSVFGHSYLSLVHTLNGSEEGSWTQVKPTKNRFLQGKIQDLH